MIEIKLKYEPTQIPTKLLRFFIGTNTNSNNSVGICKFYICKFYSNDNIDVGKLRLSSFEAWHKNKIHF